MTSTRPYIIGFILSLLLTFLAPGLIWLHTYSHHAFPTHLELYIGCVILALLQFVVQLIFFLHVKEEEGPRWRFASLAFSLIILFIIAGGALWIMADLNGRMMPDQGEMMEFMLDQGAF